MKRRGRCDDGQFRDTQAEKMRGARSHRATEVNHGSWPFDVDGRRCGAGVRPYPCGHRDALVGALGILCLFAYLIKNGHKRLTTLGSARWADAGDLSKAGMLTARSGLILGRLTVTRTRFLPALRALFSLRVDAMTACRQFLSTLRSKPQNLLVKLNAVHTAVFAPTGVGKGVSLVIPFLQTLPGLLVVVDFKGELARLTAARRRAMGHRRA